MHGSHCLGMACLPSNCVSWRQATRRRPDQRTKDSGGAPMICACVNIQAQRAFVMQPRVRRTLGIESPHVFISPNPNGVPSKVERSTAFTMSSSSRGIDATPLGLVVGIACGSSRYPGLFQPWAIIRKPVGLERKETDHAPASRPRLASIKARNCSIVSARDGSRSKRSQRASNSRFSASLTSLESSAVSNGCRKMHVSSI